nr:ADP-ribosylation factor-like protein 15 [Paramormyrops kingsleyae]
MTSCLTTPETALWSPDLSTIKHVWHQLGRQLGPSANLQDLEGQFQQLQGADTIKKYWSRYYQGSQGVIFVLDSASSEEDLEVARAELHSALQHPQLCTLPFLILANHQDKPAARSVQEIKKYFELEPLARGKSWILDASSVDNMEAVKESFCQLIHLLEEKDTEAGRI